MKLTVIASVLIMLTSELSIGLASTIDYSTNSVDSKNHYSVAQSLNFLPGNEDREPPDSNPGGSRYGNEDREPPDCCHDGGSR